MRCALHPPKTDFYTQASATNLQHPAATGPDPASRFTFLASHVRRR